MESEVWRLPGPSAFVRRTADELADGNSIVVGFPARGERRFSAAVGQVVEAAGVSWQAFDGSSCGEGSNWDPTVWLAERLLPSGSPRTIPEILKRDDLPTIFAIDRVPAGTLEAWLRFLHDYQHRKRNQEQPASVILLVTEAAPRQALRTNDAAIRSREWRGALSRLDIQMLAAREEDGRGELERLVHVEIACELARFDPDLAEQLLDAPLESLWKPESILRENGLQRGWTADDQLWMTWEKGAEDLWGGTSALHSSALVLSGRTDFVLRRLWRALVRAVFPALEEERLRLLEEFKHRIVLPVETTYGPVTEYEDLELADMARNPVLSALPRDVREYVKTLKGIRHQLAHLEVASFEAVSVLWNEHRKHTARCT